MEEMSDECSIYWAHNIVYARYSGLDVGSQIVCSYSGSYKYKLFGTRVFSDIIILRI